MIEAKVEDIELRDTFIKTNEPCSICGVPDMIGYYVFEEGKPVKICIIHKIKEYYEKNINNKYADLNTRKENSDDITNKRKLSSIGDFTGTLSSHTQASLFSDINNALSLCQTIIDMVNDRESIGTIYDGGNYVDTIPPTITIEGGLY